MSILEFHNISKFYDAGTHALNGVSFTLEEGEFVSVIGPSGAGKSTILRCCNRLIEPTEGRVWFDGKDITTVGKKELRQVRTQTGMIFQHYNLVDRLSVMENVLHGRLGQKSTFAGMAGIYTEEEKMEAFQILESLDLAQQAYKRCDELSGGQKQLLNLASIMAMQPEVLILDEPTSQLDPIAASDFLNTVRKINMELGTTVIITEHRLEDIFPYADRAIVMDGGKVIADDTPRNIGQLLWEQKNDMFTAMPTPVRVFYGAAGEGNCPLTVREGRTWLSRSFPEGVKKNACSADLLPEEIENPALSLKELWFRYEKNSPDILRGVSAEVAAGSLFAIVGGNGAGKSTTLKAICGICKPYRGKVKIFGKPIEKYKSAELFLNFLAMLPQDPKSLFVAKTVREELEEMTRDQTKIGEIAAVCEIENLLGSHPYDLSGGEQQRAALAKVLLTNPRLLLLDEPTKGIDSFFKEKLAKILCKLKRQGITIVMVSHDVEFCAKYADAVSMFFDGQVLTTDTPRRFFGNNSFYTTAANRMSRHVFSMAVTAEDVVNLYRENRHG